MIEISILILLFMGLFLLIIAILGSLFITFIKIKNNWHCFITLWFFIGIIGIFLVSFGAVL